MVTRFRVGVITGTHGLRGEVKVYPTTDEPARFLDLEQVILDTGRQERVLKLRSVKFFKKFVILGFEGLDRIEDVERLKGAELLIPREEAYELEEGEYFIPDLLGLRVVTEDGRELGVIKDVIETGANNVYDVRNEDGKGILIPAISDCVLDVNLEEGTMKVHLLPGLEDL
ncbi:MAG TPA: 16S rRNA processing protein RimM [Lachnospiraceae bacterium]|nr:16S rRNA processing protein RimM [Lachnospiraceae bacterium]